MNQLTITFSNSSNDAPIILDRFTYSFSCRQPYSLNIL